MLATRLQDLRQHADLLHQTVYLLYHATPDFNLCVKFGVHQAQLLAKVLGVFKLGFVVLLYNAVDLLFKLLPLHHHVLL